MKLLTVSRDQLAERDSFNPRDHMELAELETLAASIKEQGILSPLIVRPNGQPDTYYVIAGARRLAAAALAGVDEIPVTVREDDRDELAIALIENVQRSDINVIEEARALERLKAEGRNQRDIARVTGLPQERVKNRLALLALPDEVQSLVRDGLLTNKAIEQIKKVSKLSHKATVILATEAAEDDVYRKVLEQDLYNACTRIKGGPEVPIYASQTYHAITSVPWTQEELEGDVAELLTYSQWINVMIDEDHYDALRGLGTTIGPKGSYVCFSPEAMLDVAREQVAEILASYRERAEEQAKYQAPVPVREDGAPLSEVEVKALEKAKKQEENAQEKEARKKAEVHNENLGAQLHQMPLITPDLDSLKVVCMMALHQGHELAGEGMRLTHPNWRTVERKVLKSGDQRSKIVYPDKADSSRLFGEFIGGAQTAEELLTRTLQVVLANVYADKQAVARSNRWGESPRAYRHVGNELDRIGELYLSEPVREHKAALDAAKPSWDRDSYEHDPEAEVDEDGYPEDAADDGPGDEAIREFLRDPEEDQDED